MNLKLLLEKRATKQAEMKALIDGANAEERAMNTEEIESFEKLEAEIRELDATIKAIQTQRELEDETPQEEEEEKEERSLEEREIEAFENFIRGNVEEIRSGERSFGMISWE